MVTMTGRKHLIQCIDGQSVALHDFGGEGPVLLMLHSAGFLGQAFAPMAASLRDKFHCYAPDIRGHGDSAPAATAENGFAAPEGFIVGMQAVLPTKPSQTSLRHVRTLVSDVLCVTAWLQRTSDGTPLFAFGHSLGGLLSLAAEIERPGTFAALFLFEPACWELSSKFAEGQLALRNERLLSDLAMRRKTHFPSREAVLENWKQKLPFNHFDIEALALLVEHSFAPQAGDCQQVALVCDAKRVEAYGYIIITYLAGATFDRLSEVTCPVAVARGTGGWPTDFLMNLMPHVAARLPRSHLITLEGLHHFGPLEAPKRLAEATYQFLTDAVSNPVSKL